MVVLIILIFLLALSPILPFQGGAFFFFVIVNVNIQSGVVAYLQTAVIGLAALFGPQAVQSTFSGQAGVAVVISIFQLLSVAASLGQEGASMALILPQYTKNSASLSLSAYLFFGISTGCMVLALVSHTLLVRTAAYRKVMQPLDAARRALREDERIRAAEVSEHAPLLSRRDRSRPAANISPWEIGKNNVVYNLALSYVLVITLVCYLMSTVGTITHSIRIGCFSADHQYNPFRQSSFMGNYQLPRYLYFIPLPSFQCWRLVRSPPVLFPDAPRLVTVEATGVLVVAISLCRAIPRLQFIDPYLVAFRTNIVRCENTLHQLGSRLLRYRTCVRCLEWISRIYGDNGSVLFGTQ